MHAYATQCTHEHNTKLEDLLAEIFFGVEESIFLLFISILRTFIRKSLFIFVIRLIFFILVATI